MNFVPLTQQVLILLFILFFIDFAPGIPLFKNIPCIFALPVTAGPATA